MGSQDMEDLVTTTAAEVGPAVVGIGRGWSMGSGVVIGPGQVLTNAHNLIGTSEGAVTFTDGRTVTVETFGADVDADLAVLRLDTGDIDPVAWADDLPGTGAMVTAAANPGGRGLRVTLGQVASVSGSFRTLRGRRVSGALEHTAPLPSGSSGGPLLDRERRLVGLNTNRLGHGFYAALPADARLRARVERLARGEATTPQHLGVGLVPGRTARQLRRAVGLADREGVLVQVVEEASAAARGGLRRGDLIVTAGGRVVSAIDDLHAALDQLGENEPLDLEVVRGAEEVPITIEFDS